MRDNNILTERSDGRRRGHRHCPSSMCRRDYTRENKRRAPPPRARRVNRGNVTRGPRAFLGGGGGGGGGAGDRGGRTALPRAPGREEQNPESGLSLRLRPRERVRDVQALRERKFNQQPPRTKGSPRGPELTQLAAVPL